MTGGLSALGNHLALAVRRRPVLSPKGAWHTQAYRAGIAAQLLAAFIAGAVLAGIALNFTTNLALLPPIAVMLVLALVSTPGRLPAEALTMNQPMGS
jgi:uncharacterized membrane protein YoaK (UPF0700 family)